MMNWLRLETRIRQCLRTATRHTDTKDLALIVSEISNILGEETGRGYEIPADWWKRFEEKK